MTHRLGFVALLVALCSAILILPFSASAAPQRANLLENIPVTGTLADGGTFEGVLSVTNLAYEDGQLLASGTLSGTATSATGTVTEITQSFTDVVANLFSDGGECDILFLEIGPIFLDLLGLQVDLSQIVLDIDAVRGAGNLLGNLLCALVGLLDQGGPLAGIQGLLDQINNLL